VVVEGEEEVFEGAEAGGQEGGDWCVGVHGEGFGGGGDVGDGGVNEVWSLESPGIMWLLILGCGLGFGLGSGSGSGGGSGGGCGSSGDMSAVQARSHGYKFEEVKWLPTTCVIWAR
jgi:hypothetical protein